MPRQPRLSQKLSSPHHNMHTKRPHQFPEPSVKWAGHASLSHKAHSKKSFPQKTSSYLGISLCASQTQHPQGGGATHLPHRHTAAGTAASAQLRVMFRKLTIPRAARPRGRSSAAGSSQAQPPGKPAAAAQPPATSNRHRGCHRQRQDGGLDGASRGRKVDARQNKRGWDALRVADCDCDVVPPVEPSEGLQAGVGW